MVQVDAARILGIVYLLETQFSYIVGVVLKFKTIFSNHANLILFEKNYYKHSQISFLKTTNSMSIAPLMLKIFKLDVSFNQGVGLLYYWSLMYSIKDLYLSMDKILEGTSILSEFFEH